MDSELTPAFVRQYLWCMAGIAVDLDEATRLVPYIRGTRAAMERLYRFDVQQVRPSVLFDPSSPYKRVAR
ncbi:MAG: hypothetical protein ACKVVP_15115 [Chloroflexota bacterium]